MRLYIDILNHLTESVHVPREAEEVGDSAKDNEYDTVRSMDKYRKYSEEEKWSIARMRAYRMADTYADGTSAKTRDVQKYLANSDSPRDLAYWDKECKKKLYD